MLLNYLRTRGLGKAPKWALNVPIIVATGAKSRAEFDPLSFVKERGVDLILHKPFKPQLLLQKVAEMLDEKTDD